MVGCCPLRICLWDPFQMAELYGLYIQVSIMNHIQVLGAHPPSSLPETNNKFAPEKIFHPKR